MDSASLRNFKDFLQLYNLVSETCFNNCVSSMHERDLQKEEIGCVEKCAGKFVKMNHAIMATFVEVQPIIVNKRIEEMQAANATIQQQQAPAVSPETVQAAETTTTTVETTTPEQQ